ncbi:MAG: polyprenyl synthetase family protein [Candidatus Stahlbacteria bacterium]|nr:polyprenyl synthetase family protein [Candidatus Stahlbacteria bacterium]
MEFEIQLKEYKNRIDQFLLECLEPEKRRASSINPCNERILEFIIDFCSRGGKRIRPILLIKGYEAVGGNDLTEITRTSICMELLEAYLLIHDDIIDRDETRRGGLSFHKMAQKWSGETHFGLSSGIIAGDMLGGMAIKIIMASNFSESSKLRALNEFIEAELNCFHGELYDVILEHEDTSEQELLKMIDLKTSSYTTQAPLVIGAILGNGTDEQIAILREYGGLLGRAFQITDDILGTFGDEKTTGKPAASDIKQGKKTLLLVYALNHSSTQEINFLHHSIGNKELTTNDIETVRQIFINTGALDYAKISATRYAEKAKSVMEASNLSGKEFLIWLTDFVVKRKL